MKVTISGHHMNTGSSLQEYVTERASGVVLRYFPNAVSANILFEKQGHLYICDINLNEGTGRKILVRSSCSSDDPYSSFDSSMMKLEKQLRRYKSKISYKASRPKTSDAIEVISATKYVISPTREIAEGDDTEDNPVIIAEKQVEIETLSVSDAVMRMDLANLPALMFKNIKNDRMNVVYYRKDGNISWVDSK
jgi:ribosomal subunit interface protein